MNNYNDIINHPHHVSKTHPHMSMEQRAAQFAPFAALTGYEKSIAEALEAKREEVENERHIDHSELP